jgi:hypothetical protein
MYEQTCYRGFSLNVANALPWWAPEVIDNIETWPVKKIGAAREDRRPRLSITW